MGRLLVFLSFLCLDFAFGYSTRGNNCDVFCMNNVRTLETALVEKPGALHLLFHGRQFALHCTTRANMSACFNEVPECTAEMNQEGVEELIDYMCTNAPAIERGASCYMDEKSSEVMKACYKEIVGNYCDLPICIENGLSSVSSCTDDDAELAYNVGMFVLRGC